MATKDYIFRFIPRTNMMCPKICQNQICNNNNKIHSLKNNVFQNKLRQEGGTKCPQASYVRPFSSRSQNMFFFVKDFICDVRRKMLKNSMASRKCRPNFKLWSHYICKSWNEIYLYVSKKAHIFRVVLFIFLHASSFHDKEIVMSIISK